MMGNPSGAAQVKRLTDARALAQRSVGAPMAAPPAAGALAGDPPAVGTLAATTTYSAAVAVWRDIEANWSTVNPIIPEGELCWTKDLNQIRIGDGASHYNDLSPIFDGTISAGDLVSAVAACETAQAAAETARDEADAFSAESGTQAAAALSSANLARDYAQAPAGTTLPTGGLSAMAAADRANDIAIISREIPINVNPVIANETYAAGFLGTRRRCVPAASQQIIITIPAGIFTRTEMREMWGLYRLDTNNSGASVKFVAATGGTGYRTPKVLYSGHQTFRKDITVANQDEQFTYTIPVPTCIDGRLVVVASIGAVYVTAGHHMTVTAPGRTFNVVAPLVQDALIARNIHCGIYEASLGAFAAANLAVTITGGPAPDIIGASFFVIDEPGGTIIAKQQQQSTAGASISATLNSLVLGSRVCASAWVRGVTTHQLSNFSSNLALLGRETSLNKAETSVSDTNAYKNAIYGEAAGVVTVAGDFTAQATFTNANNQPTMGLFAYPPVADATALVDLRFQNGVEVLNTPYNEAQLWFLPDGKTCVVQI